MAYAINIRSEHESAEPVRALWQRAATFEAAPSMQALGYAPHISFAIYDDADEAVLKRALGEVFAGQPSLCLTFAAIAWFDIDPLVLWLRPEQDERLYRLHQRICAATGTTGIIEHYRPGNWVPHCSLALAVATDQREAAIAFARRPLERFRVRFDLADVVAFRPVRVVSELSLGLSRTVAHETLTNECP